MHRARRLVFKTYPDFAHAFRERNLVTSIVLKLSDRQIVSVLVVVEI